MPKWDFPVSEGDPTLVWKLAGETVVPKEHPKFKSEYPMTFPAEVKPEATVSEIMAELDALKIVAMASPETVIDTPAGGQKVAEDDILAKIDQVTGPPPPPLPNETWKVYKARTGESDQRAASAFVEFGTPERVPKDLLSSSLSEAEQAAADELEGKLDFQALMLEYRMTRVTPPTIPYGAGWMGELQELNPDGQSKEKRQEIEYLTNCLLDAIHNGGVSDWVKAVELTNKLYEKRPTVMVPGKKGKKAAPTKASAKLQNYGAEGTKEFDPAYSKSLNPKLVKTKGYVPGSAKKLGKKFLLKAGSASAAFAPAGYTSYGHKIMSCSFTEGHHSPMPQGTEDNPYMMQPFQTVMFAAGTKGSKGLCAHDSAPAVWMVKGESRWWSLCEKHAEKWTGWDYRVDSTGKIIGAAGTGL